MKNDEMGKLMDTYMDIMNSETDINRRNMITDDFINILEDYKKEMEKERRRRIIMLCIFIAVAVILFYCFGVLYGILAVSIMITVYVIYVYCRDILDGLI